MINPNILKNCNCKSPNHNNIVGAYKIFFGTLVSESRLKIINLLREKSMNVTEITNKLKLDQTAVSHDLQRLKKCGFVNVEVNGKFRNYKLNSKTISPLMKLIDQHMSDYCIHILNRKK
jgi:DNA-binding transcriptional ArsR family regulator